MDLIQNPQFLQQIANAKVLRHKRNRNRLYLTADDQIIKIFYARDYFLKAKKRVAQFLKNIQRLQQHQIGTVHVTKIEEYQESKSIAVSYPFIHGKTPLELYTENQDICWLYLTLEKLHVLQQKGIYFRDFHVDNILLDDQKNFFLLDIHNIKFLHHPLSLRHCCHNIATLCTYFESKHLFSEELVHTLIEKYLATTTLTPWKKNKFRIGVHHIIKFLTDRRQRGKLSNSMFKCWWWLKPVDLYEKSVIIMLRFLNCKQA